MIIVTMDTAMVTVTMDTAMVTITMDMITMTTTIYYQSAHMTQMMEAAQQS